MVQLWFKRAANALGGGLFLTLFVVFIVQITARFGFNRPLPRWCPSASMWCSIWSGTAWAGAAAW